MGVGYPWGALKQRLHAALYRRLRGWLKPFIVDVLNNDFRVYGDVNRVTIAPTARLVNALLNTVSGSIAIGEYTFCGHNVALITGTHDPALQGAARMLNVPLEGRDIDIGSGVWIGTNAIVLGPCRIGDHAVVAAGAVVTKDVPAHTIVAGVPARPIRTLDLPPGGAGQIGVQQHE